MLKVFFTPCSSVSIVNFERVIAGWDYFCVLYYLSSEAANKTF